MTLLGYAAFAAGIADLLQTRRALRRNYPILAHFHQNPLKTLAELIAAAGLPHPSQLKPHHSVRRISPHQVKLAPALLPYLQPGALLDPSQRSRLPPVFGLYWPVAQAESLHPLT